MERVGLKWFSETYEVWNGLFDSADPQPSYQRVFADCPHVEPVEGMHIVGSRAGADEILRNPEVYSAHDVIAIGNRRPQIPISVEPPEHTRYREILNPLFSPRRMQAMVPDFQENINGLIDAVIADGRCDFTTQIATPLPSASFLTFMGLPAEDLEDLLSLKDAIFHPVPTTPGDYDEVYRMQVAGYDALYAYFDRRLDERVAAPTEDTLTSILTATIDDRPLTRDEMLDICANIALAGLDTLTAGLTTCMAFFALHPDKREQILERPELIESAVEELLRWESPVSAVFRRAAVDTEFDGCPIKAGEFVHVNLGAANLDPEEFPNPMQVDFGRTVNRHYAFGKGIHRCLGSHLARRVLRVSIEEWHRRIPRYRLSDNVELRYFTPTRGVGNLQLEW